MLLVGKKEHKTAIKKEAEYEDEKAEEGYDDNSTPIEVQKHQDYKYSHQDPCIVIEPSGEYHSDEYDISAEKTTKKPKPNRKPIKMKKSASKGKSRSRCTRSRCKKPRTSKGVIRKSKPSKKPRIPEYGSDYCAWWKRKRK